MKKILAFALFLNLSLAGCSLGIKSAAVNPDGTPHKPETRTIDIKNFTFMPATQNIYAGDTVVWTNQDPTIHDIKGEQFGTDSLKAGQTYQYTFTKPGTYDYACTIHANMRGTVIVK